MSDEIRLLPLAESGCSCGPAHDQARAKATPKVAAGSGPAYSVAGLTCGHCVSSVIEEVEAIEGVRSVSIDLVPGGESGMRIDTARELTRDEVAAAVAEAGYRLAKDGGA